MNGPERVTRSFFVCFECGSMGVMNGLERATRSFLHASAMYGCERGVKPRRGRQVG